MTKHAKFSKLWAEHKLTIARHTGIASIPSSQKLNLNTTPNAYKLKFQQEERKNNSQQSHGMGCTCPSCRKPTFARSKILSEGRFAKFRKLWSTHKATHEAASELEKGIFEETKEHGMTPEEARKTALEHLQGDPLYYSHIKEMENKYKKVQHGQEIPNRVARHSSIGMDDYAEIDLAFIKEGNWHTGGVAYHYPWEVIERDAKSFEGKDFYLNHIEDAGVEYGIIDKVYPTTIDGVNWMAAKVHIPEKPFTANLLDRMETGLASNVSSTHEFIVDPKDDSKTVQKMQGRAISLVKEPEVDGAKILSVKRKLKSKKKKKQMKAEIAGIWKGNK